MASELSETESTEGEIARLLDNNEYVEWHNAGRFKRSIDVRFREGCLGHSRVLDILRNRGYSLQYIDFDNRSVCFMG